MCRIGLCVFCLLKFSVAMCILLVKNQKACCFCDKDNDKEWKFKEQHANVGKYCGGEKILSPPLFQHCGGERPVAPAVPTPLPSDRNVRRWQRAVFRPVSFCMLYNRINVMKGGTNRQTDT